MFRRGLEKLPDAPAYTELNLAREARVADPEQAKPPLHTLYLTRLANHRAVAILIVIGTIVIAFASFTDSAKKLASTFHKQRPEEAREELVHLNVPFTPEAFVLAANAGDLTVTKLFLAAGMPVDEIPGGTMVTALVGAVRGNRPEVVEVLLKAGADPGLSTPAFASALSSAAVRGYTSIATALLNSRTLPKKVIDDAFLDAGERGQPQMLELLQVHGADARGLATKALIKAVRSIDANEQPLVGAVSFLLDAGADINALSGDMDWTPLHCAVHYSYPAVIRVLLERGATVDARDRDGRTPLWIAASDATPTAVELLLAKGADATAHDKHGVTVLRAAKDRGADAGIIKMLKDNGAK